MTDPGRETLTLVLDQLVARVPGGIGRYTRELARAVANTTPEGWQVDGLVSRTPPADAERIRRLVPGLRELHRLPLDRRLLARAWAQGIPAGRIPAHVHSASVLAPLTAHRRGTRPSVVATVHDVVPWTHPETLTARGARWHRRMGERAARYADAIVVPTAAVASALAEILGLGDRIRVIPGAVSAELGLPEDAGDRATRLELPDAYVLAVGTLEPRKGLSSLIDAMARPGVPKVPLLIAGPTGWGGVDVAEFAARAGLGPGRVRALGSVSDADLAVLYQRASVFVMPSLAEGFGLPVLEAFSHGTAVIHSDDPALTEVAGGAGRGVALAGDTPYSQRLAEALIDVLGDPDGARRLATLGARRARDFDWNASATMVWALHRELS
ncbi:glycosyltransferase family 1 protein [Agromyces sp. LHK192]|uniref:glycosyltransferase family 4 protein n=1 Tax=Agromyces sp. LHK192 TaxID=2498704 RepID=UPI000FDA5428|nr:glycosyltransferase family 1 protein [Agromyces sp. LHK192]